MNNNSELIKPHVLRHLFWSSCFFLAFGCASFSDGAFRQIEGQFFDDRLVGNIVDEQTTEEQILAWFGPPELVSTSDGGMKNIRYYSVRTRRSVERRVFVEEIHDQTVEQELILTISLGLVTSHQYRSRSYSP